jgi:mRNA interferase RelE/StbE
MKYEIRESFVKDSLKLPAKIQNDIAAAIHKIEKAGKISELPSCKKLQGYKTAYRIRIGNYRIGFFYEKNTIELVRVLDRKNMYRYFP